MADDLRRALLPGERVLWEGWPHGGIIFRPVDAILIPFSLLWGGFAVFWNVQVWSADQRASDLSFKLFGLPFLIAALYITFGRFLIDRWLRRRLRYAVTDRRILIHGRRSGSTWTSVDIRMLPSIELAERPDGTGTIRFGASPSLFDGRNFGIWQPTFDPTPQFMRIPQVRTVYELIQRQAHA
jgi:hypothetical protein